MTQAEARPPRQIDDTIPKELERICLKALSKRASERYTHRQGHGGRPSLVPPNHRRHGLACCTCGSRELPPGSTLEAAPLPPTSRQSDSDQRPIKIVPKGLRSFDEHDADFFLELLPGPRDRDGLPESIRFWKTKDRADRSRPDLQGRADLRTLAGAANLAGQGGTAAPAGQARPPGLRRGDPRGDRSPAAQGLTQGVS